MSKINLKKIREKSKENFLTFVKKENFKKNDYWANSDLCFLKNQPILPNKPSSREESKFDITPVLKLFNLNPHDFYLVVIHNQNWVIDYSTSLLNDYQGKMELNPFTELDSQMLDWEKVLQNQSNPQNIFLNLNLASFQKGLCFKLKKDQALKKPILLIRTTDEFAPISCNNLIVFDLAQNTQLKLVELYDVNLSNLKTSTIYNQTLFFHLHDRAHLDHFTYQNEKKNIYHIHSSHLQLEEESTYRSFVIQMGGKLGISQRKIVFNQEKSTALLNGFFLANADQNLDHLIDIEHQVGNCISKQNYRGIIKKNGKVGFTGKVNVAPQAQKTDSSQLNKVIVLDPQASIHSRPQLEIFADDVKCGHGATVGKFEEENIFYLMSRGISLNQAEKILISAFAQDFLSSIKESFPLLKNWLIDTLFFSSFSSFWESQGKKNDL